MIQKSNLPEGWQNQHPAIQSSFYASLVPPDDRAQAKNLAHWHMDAVHDFELQVEITDQEIKICKLLEDEQPHQREAILQFEEKKLKLMLIVS